MLNARDGQVPGETIALELPDDTDLTAALLLLDVPDGQGAAL